MDAGIVDTLNRVTAKKIAAHLDLTDWFCGVKPDDPATGTVWYRSNLAAAFTSTLPRNSDRAWLLGALAVKTPDVDFDSIPADCDWENLFSHIRTEIGTRRGPKVSDEEIGRRIDAAAAEGHAAKRDLKIPHDGVAEICPDGVV